MKRSLSAVISALIAIGYFGAGSPAKATPSETYFTDGAYCEYHPKNPEQAVSAMPCSFVQDEWQVDILWADGVYSKFENTHERHDGTFTGIYLDRRGGVVYQLENPSDRSRHFQMESGALFVYLR